MDEEVNPKQLDVASDLIPPRRNAVGVEARLELIQEPEVVGLRPIGW
jgi:hypothetical protein